MSNQNRRQFLMMAFGAGGVAALGVASLWRGGGQAAAVPAKKLEGLQAVQRRGRALGTEVQMIVLHERRERAEAALDAAFAELELVEEIMSIYRPGSQLSRLNRDGEVRDPHPYFVEVLRRAQAMAERSGGAFDVTVQPLWELYAAAQKSGELPAPARIAAARRLVDWTKLEASPARVRLAPGMKATLNGIAQGYAGDRVLATLRSFGVTHALANTGEVAALGAKAGGQPWVAGIQHPREADALLGLASLDGRCLSTSGDYATNFSADRAYNHIFDPATGASPGAFSSVSVVAPDCTGADALSTAVFVAGPDKGLELVRATPGAEALFVHKDGTQRKTDGFPLQA
ncbi:MAG: FAD:protein FMN transferase [Planctomycetota bacterium]|nr:FAD:protein FMN transferase [Planctomycetota bacterium]